MRAIEKHLGERHLIWFGTRGEDPESLNDIRQFSGSFSIIGGMRSRPSVSSASLESFANRRPDLDTFEIDDLLRTEPVAKLRDVILRALARPSALVATTEPLFVGDWILQTGPMPQLGNVQGTAERIRAQAVA